MLTLVSFSLFTPQSAAMPPKVGEKAPAFEVRTMDEKTVRLAALLKRGPVVLVVLRGYPGYQCPLCTRQVGELMQRSEEFSKRKATVVMVYPGPAENLKRYAKEFLAGKDVPKEFRFALDPDFRLTERYGLRWKAPNETAYPSTFVIRPNGWVAYAKISRSHGDRAPLLEILTSLDQPK